MRRDMDLIRDILKPVADSDVPVDVLKAVAVKIATDMLL